MQQFHGDISVLVGQADDGIKIESEQTNDKIGKLELIVPNGKRK